MDLLINTILPFILFIGFVFYGFKVYNHFLVLKIVNNYPSDLNFMKFMSYINYKFFDRLILILPFYFRIDLNKYPKEKQEIISKLERRILATLIIAVIGFLTIPLGIYLQNHYQY